MITEPLTTKAPKRSVTAIVLRVIAWLLLAYVWYAYALILLEASRTVVGPMGSIGMWLRDEMGFSSRVASLALPVVGGLIMSAIFSVPSWILFSIARGITRRTDMRHRWSSGEGLPGVQFSIHQRVRVTAGKHAGAAGQLIEIHTLTPEPLFQLKTAEGRDLYLRQSTLSPDAA